MKRISAAALRKLKRLRGWMFSRGYSYSTVSHPDAWPEKDREWWIYFLRGDDNGPIKIGRTREPRNRLCELQSGYPFGELGFVGLVRAPLRLEKELHRRFAKHRLRGEWFNPAAELCEFILKLEEPS